MRVANQTVSCCRPHESHLDAALVCMFVFVCAGPSVLGSPAMDQFIKLHAPIPPMIQDVASEKDDVSCYTTSQRCFKSRSEARHVPSYETLSCMADVSVDHYPLIRALMQTRQTNHRNVGGKS